MPASRWSVVRNSLILSALLTLPTFAQSDKPSPNDNRPVPARDQLVTMQFTGGTAAEFVEAVRQASSDANIVVLADLSQVSMPPVGLRNVDLGAALRVLQSLRSDSSDRHIAIHILEEQGTGQSDEQSVFTVSGDIQTRKRSAAPRDSLVLQMGDVLDEQVKAADMLTAIEAALAMLEPDFPAPQIKFHEATALLIARGQAEQMACIQLLVQQLRQRKMISEQPVQKQLQDLQNAVAESNANKKAAVDFQMRADMLEQRLTIVQRELEVETARANEATADRDTMRGHVHTLEQELKKAKGG